MAVDHYENFPVASLLVPRRLRTAVRDIYRFARSADDIADEGHADDGERLEQLGRYRAALEQIRGQGLALPPGDPLEPVFAPLERTMERHALPVQPFLDLLSAFEQDIGIHRYESETALLDYCTRSANPVGCLILHLHGAASEANMRDSDAICTGLQLVNFWQDVAIDWAKGRVYIPAELMREFNVSEVHIRSGLADARWQALMAHLAQQAGRLLRQGRPLTRALPGRAGFELELVIQGGLRILERLDQLHYDVFRHRPTLQKRDWLLLFGRGLRVRCSPARPSPNTDVTK